MDFYNLLLARKLGGGGGDPNETFKIYMSGDLTDITADMLEGSTTIRSYAFYNDAKFKSITIPSSVTTIGTYAFYGCTSLTSITIPSSVTSIERYAFWNSGIQQLNILPDSSIIYQGDYSVFGGCPQLTKVRTASSIGMYAFYNGNYPPSQYTSPNIETLELLEGVQSIGMYAFMRTKIASLTFPSSLTTIGSNAFAYTKITSLTIPPTLTNIGQTAFENCTLLQDVTFSEGYESFQSRLAFYNCTALEEVTLPSTITRLSSMPFSGCTSLTRITIKATTPPYSTQFLDGADNAIIYVPAGSVDAYKSSWSTYASRIQAIPSD